MASQQASSNRFYWGLLISVTCRSPHVSPFDSFDSTLCLGKGASTHNPLADAVHRSVDPDLLIVLLQERPGQASSSDGAHFQAICVVPLPVVEPAVVHVLVCRTDILVTASWQIRLQNVARFLQVNASLLIVDGPHCEVCLEGRVDVGSIPDETTTHRPLAWCEASATVSSRRGGCFNQRCRCLFKGASTHNPLADAVHRSVDPDLRIALLQEHPCQASSSDGAHFQACCVVPLPVVEPAVVHVLVCRTDILVTASRQVRLQNVARFLQVNTNLLIVDGPHGEIGLEGRVHVSSVPDEPSSHSPSALCEAGATVSSRLACDLMPA